MTNTKEMRAFEEMVEQLEKAQDDKTIAEVFRDMGYTDSEELSEAALDSVAGGLRELDALKWLIENVDWIGYGWQGAKMAARCIYDGVKYGNPYRTYSKKQVNKMNAKLDKSIPGWVKKLGELGAF